MPTFERYVAIGDSSTEGLEDAVPGARHRGWADRLAQHVASAQGRALMYANLAVRGRKIREVLEEQLAPALSFRPDLASVFAGTNDIIRSRVDLDAVCADLHTMQRALREIGATVVTITMPDLSEVLPLARRIQPRLEAFNARVRELSVDTGSLVLDVAAYPVASDPRLWHEDRLHANSEGHRRIAAGLAYRLGLPGFGEEWGAPLPPRPAPGIVANATAELRWVLGYLFPWILRRVTGRSSGDGVSAKRPALEPVHP
ncbi:MAG: SGNH/GDSL hydrolase family protein [Gemmatimonadaceae bacterium]|nr:SGNH/GDSL hydrolase family protein [Gemmatimonadaceae bacterium]